MQHPEVFQVTFAVTEALSPDDRRRMARHVKAALEHWRKEVGFLEGEDSPGVVETYRVEPVGSPGGRRDG